MDGADFLVQVPPEDAFEALQPFQTFGRVQAKYVAAGNAVRIPREHVMDEAEVRHDYFLFVHSDDADGRHVRWFLAAAEIHEALRPSRDGRSYVFRPGKAEGYERFRDRSARRIVNTIRRTLRRVHAQRLRALEREANAPFAIANTHRGARFTYHFRRFEGAPVVLYREQGKAGARVLDARRDLYDSPGDFAWGYRGSGPYLLATSLLAHHLEREPTVAERDRFLDFLEDLRLEAVDLATEQVDAILSGPHGRLDVLDDLARGVSG